MVVIHLSLERERAPKAKVGDLMLRGTQRYFVTLADEDEVRLIHESEYDSLDWTVRRVWYLP